MSFEGAAIEKVEPLSSSSSSSSDDDENYYTPKRLNSPYAAGALNFRAAAAIAEDEQDKDRVRQIMSVRSSL